MKISTPTPFATILLSILLCLESSLGPCPLKRIRPKILGYCGASYVLVLLFPVGATTSVGLEL
ncbi:hypothetical protein CVS40_5538 [Lucilia cuprina]|nr:hypothetical protein CVS40_5538 [Lucilia cuprina]